MRCSTGERPGTVALERALISTFGREGASSAGIFNCRRVEGSSTWSVHADGRALDLRPGRGGQLLGDEMLIALLAASWELGLQRVIWWRMQYDANDPEGRPYTGPNPHIDHLHIEQEPNAAQRLDVGSAIALLASLVPEDTDMQLLVQYGGGVWVVGSNLATRTRVGSTADQIALQGTGEYRVVTLTAEQMALIPDSRLSAGPPM